MTEKEILRILAVCKGAGVNFGDADEDVIIEIWKNCFKDFTYQEVSKALFKLINSKKGLCGGVTSPAPPPVSDRRRCFPLA